MADAWQVQAGESGPRNEKALELQGLDRFLAEAVSANLGCNAAQNVLTVFF